jgi:hypothetical protein
VHKIYALCTVIKEAARILPIALEHSTERLGQGLRVQAVLFLLCVYIASLFLSKSSLPPCVYSDKCQHFSDVQYSAAVEDRKI